MRKHSYFQLVVTGTARRDIADIVRWSLREFSEAALRYEALIDQALLDIQNNPERPGSTERLGLAASARTYHLSLSRDRVAGEKVKAPRHFILYCLSAASVIEVGRILHDGRDLASHLAGAFKPSDPSGGA